MNGRTFSKYQSLFFGATPSSGIIRLCGSLLPGGMYPLCSVACVHLSITAPMRTKYIYSAGCFLYVYVCVCKAYIENRSLSFTNEVQSITILRVTRQLYRKIREEQIKILVLFSSHSDDEALNLKENK